MTLLSISLVLFLIIDPLGNIKPFLESTERIPANRKQLVIAREMLIALFVMFLFSIIGEYIFQLLQISETSVRLSSGIILFLIALQILFPFQRNLRNNLPKEDPFIIPLAIPLIAGPSLLATILLYARIEESYWIMWGAMLIAWFLASVILVSAEPIKRILGNNGLLACEKLMGMVLILMAIQRFMDGVHQFVAGIPK